MRTLITGVLVALLAGCGSGATADLPIVAAPTTPLPTLPSADALTAVGPTSLTGTPGSSSVVQVRATRANGSAVYGVIVVFQSQAGGGSIQPLSTTTDDEGIASTTWTFGSRAGVNLLMAVGGFTTSPVTFTASTASASPSRAP
jgi:hypothetical protein